MKGICKGNKIRQFKDLQLNADQKKMKRNYTMSEMQINKDSLNKNKISQKLKSGMTLSTKLLGFTVILLAVAVFSLGLIAINLGTSAVTKESNTNEKAYVTQGASHIGDVIAGNLENLHEITLRSGISTMDYTLLRSMP